MKYYCPYEVLDDGTTLTLATFKCFAKAVEWAREVPCVVGIDEWDDDEPGDVVWVKGMVRGRGEEGLSASNKTQPGE